MATTLHLFGSMLAKTDWEYRNHAVMLGGGWSRRSGALYTHPRGDEYHLFPALSRHSAERLRGMVVDHLKVDGPWTTALYELHEIAKCMVRPSRDTEKPA